MIRLGFVVNLSRSDGGTGVAPARPIVPNGFQERSAHCTLTILKFHSDLPIFTVFLPQILLKLKAVCDSELLSELGLNKKLNQLKK